jgi:predicted TIM-barrel fold metal-dependent hydrolase
MPITDMLRFGERIANMGWHIQLHILRTDDSSPLAELEPMLTKLAADLVVDHVAAIQPRRGVGQVDFQALCRLLGTGRCWVKLSDGYRLSRELPPYKDMIPFAQALVAIRPDRLVWGSDWPHVNFKGDMPNTTDQLDYLLDWVPDEAHRRQVLVDNPAVLYGF